MDLRATELAFAVGLLSDLLERLYAVGLGMAKVCNRNRQGLMTWMRSGRRGYACRRPYSSLPPRLVRKHRWLSKGIPGVKSHSLVQDKYPLRRAYLQQHDVSSRFHRAEYVGVDRRHRSRQAGAVASRARHFVLGRTDLKRRWPPPLYFSPQLVEVESSTLVLARPRRAWSRKPAPRERRRPRLM